MQFKLLIALSLILIIAAANGKRVRSRKNSRAKEKRVITWYNF